MKRLLPYLALIPIVAFGLFPPIELHQPLTDTKAWVWLFLISGFLGLATMFFDINIFAKLFIGYSFLDCFFSAGPFLSFTMYVQIVACAYFYILCIKIDNWDPAIKALQVMILLNLILLTMQRAGKDSLCNFGLAKFNCFGSVGNPMQLKSFFIISCAVLVALTKPKIKHAIIYAMLFILLAGYIYKPRLIQHFFYARGPVWIDTLDLYITHPFVGWGPGMFKTIFPALAHGSFTLEGAWMSAHNCWIQLLFETGAIGFSLIAGFFVSLASKLREIDPYSLFALTVIALDMCVHFPTRQIQCSFLMLMFLARCDRKIKEARWLIPQV